MTRALAGVGRSNLAFKTEASAPVVFVDGVPEPDLQTVGYTSQFPTDTRTATLNWMSNAAYPERRLRGRTISIAVPHAVADGETRWQVLLSGPPRSMQDTLSSGIDQQSFVVRDALAALLDETLDTLGAWPEGGVTLRALLSSLGGVLQAEVVFACDAAVLETPIDASNPQAQSIGSLLSPALTDAGLSIRQTLELNHDQIRRTLTLLPDRAGRRIALPWHDTAGRGGAVIKTTITAEQRPPRAWVGLGDRPIVEDTFDLVQGWDPTLTGQPDSDYARLTSTDFSRFGSVYRAWVLNEDGAFSDPPFDQGAAFDVGALFDEPGTITTALRFGSCLTQDASGLSITPVIESSTNSGANWSAYPGTAQVMLGRAGVLLTDDTLPAPILSAAKAGTLRLRVTASLTGADAIRDRRWDGNPFAGAGPTRLVRFGDRFAWRRVAPTSIHADAIAAGQLNADTVDDRAALRSALLDQIAQSTGPTTGAKVELAGAWTAIHPGDRARDVMGPGLAIDGGPSVFGDRSARVRRVRIDFGVSDNTPRTHLELD